MSGFEIASVVLGAIPLFIAGAQQCRSGLDMWDNFLNKPKILNRYIEELNTHLSMLILCLKNVIGATSLSGETQKALVDDAISPLWQRQDVQAQLRQSMGDTADIFQKIMERMVNVFIEQIQTDDTISNDYQHILGKTQGLRLIVAQSPESKQSWLKSFSERVKFTLKYPKRKEIMTNLRNCNDDLFKLVNAGKETRTFQRKQQVRRVHAAWQNRTQFCRLFRVLKSTCPCSCQNPHRAKLRIKPFMKDDGRVDYGCKIFDITFQQKVNCERAISVKIYRQRLDVNKTGWKGVKNICAAVEAANNADKHMALAIDEVEDLWDTESSLARTSPPAYPCLTLESLFPVFAPFAIKKFLMREKLIFAVISAYSVLQLHDSPWLNSGLSSKQLFFSGDGEDFSAATGAVPGNVLGQPYIGSDVWASPQTLSKASRVHILSLGIVLLELHLNRPIQSCSTDLVTLKPQAIDLLQEHSDDCSLSPWYYGAVRFCLFPKPGSSTRLIEFSDPGFREMYYRNVILPLEEELDQNFEIGQKFWDDL